MRIFITFPSYFLSIIETYLSFPSKEIFFNRYMRMFVSFQYSDRSTPVLLIVSLAGIKVCSPDGKVSI